MCEILIIKCHLKQLQETYHVHFFLALRYIICSLALVTLFTLSLLRQLRLEKTQTRSRKGAILQRVF